MKTLYDNTFLAFLLLNVGSLHRYLYIFTLCFVINHHLLNRLHKSRRKLSTTLNLLKYPVVGFWPPNDLFWFLDQTHPVMSNYQWISLIKRACFILQQRTH